jgi:hypothetical protein
LSRGHKEALVFQPSNQLQKNEIQRVERYLDAVRSNLLFAKGIILVEGDAEQILIPEMFKKVFGLSLDEIGLSLINIGSTGFENVARIFHKDRIQKNCAILTDLDKSIITLPLDSNKDDENQKHYRESEKNGEERKTRLTLFCDGNEFIKPFYANNTFEVDFLINGNSFEYVHCLDKIYSRETDITKAKEKLEDKSIEVSGLEILRIANKYGKGWLALLVSEQLVYNTFIPEYILKAIAFASAHMNSFSNAKAVIHRVNSIRNHKKNSLNDTAQKFIIDEKNPDDLVDTFTNTFKNDQLTKFLSFL